MMLSFWARDRTRGPRIDIGRAVRMITRDTAELYGLHDRGRIAPGYRADINVIDHDRLQLLLPEIVFDLPTGARRLMQRAQGYVATFVAGTQTIASDEATGALPGSAHPRHAARAIADPQLTAPQVSASVDISPGHRERRSRMRADMRGAGATCPATRVNLG